MSPFTLEPPAAALAAAILISLASPTALSGQEPGKPIRIQTTAHAGHWITGHLASESADSLVIVRRSEVDVRPTAPGGRYQLAGSSSREVLDTVRVARISVQRLQVSGGRKSNADRGALIGGSIVGAFGLAVGIGCASDEFFQCTGGEVAALTLVGAASGAAIGGLIGAMSHREKWKSVSIAPTVTGAGTPGVSVSLGFRF